MDIQEYCQVDTTPRCQCGGKLVLDFVNRNNRDIDGAVLRCERNRDHIYFVDIPLTTVPKYLRRFKHKFENREGSWRNKVLERLGLCTCTNTMHGHRAGIHKRNVKGDNLCKKCRGVMEG